MSQYNDEYGYWLTEQTEDSNILATLSRNLQKYQNIVKSNELNQLKITSLSERKLIKNNLHTINHPVDSNKENQKRNQLKQKHQKLIHKNWMQKIDIKKVEQSIQTIDRRQPQQKLFKIRATSRNSRSSYEQRDELAPLKVKEFKFEKKDKKKFKDRCVDLYIQNKNKISLKQIDSINKQCKQQKIDLFLKLLRR